MPITVVLLGHLGSKVVGNCRGRRKLRLYMLSKSWIRIDFRDGNRFSITSFHYCSILSFEVFRNPFGRRFFDRNKRSTDHNILSPFVLFKDRNFVMGPFSFKLETTASFVTADSFFSTKV
jgi:hypothetical protein